MKKMLLIIDAQFDFIEGSLAVNDAKDKMNRLSDYIKNHGINYEVIAFTLDWHPQDHVSFKIWPPHCVVGTKGVSLYEPLIEESKKTNADILYLKKGNDKDKEEYSVMQNELSSNTLLKYVDEHKIEEIDVCGIANEYCVHDSVVDLYHNDNLKSKINVLIDYVAAIKDPNVLVDTCNKLGINISKTNI